MLAELYIENIAVIQKASIHFKPGFQVFTGETGAGKSILIDSIHAILGQRTSRDLVRSGSEKALVTAIFSDLSERTTAHLKSLGYPPDDEGFFMITREIPAEGKGKGSVRIQGKPATVSILREVGDGLITIHGQHDNQALLSSGQHLYFIDRYGCTQESLLAYQQVYRKYTALKKQWEELQLDEAEKARRLDMLRFQLDEIADAQLIDGEEEELTSRRRIISNSEKIAESLNDAYRGLAGDENASGIRDLLFEVVSQLQQAGEYIADLEPITNKLEEFSYEVEEYCSEIYAQVEQIDYNPSELEQIERRLDVIYKLKRKYGASIAEILQYYEKITVEYESLYSHQEKLDALQIEIQKNYQKARKMAEELSNLRHQAAAELAKRVAAELAFLDMPNVRFEVNFQETKLEPRGIDTLEFMLSTNPGEPVKPISKIASGGELSRIMLALQNALADQDNMDTLIFDEIDTGVSGRAAQKIGIKLREIASHRQVICVTHLAQIAVLANQHFLIQKRVEKGHTFTEVLPLEHEGRVTEIARIMGGEPVTELMLQNADALLKSAGN